MDWDEYYTGAVWILYLGQYGLYTGVDWVLYRGLCGLYTGGSIDCIPGRMNLDGLYRGAEWILHGAE